MSELPRMYRCKIEKDINNNKRVYSSLYGDVYDSIINNDDRIDRNNYTVEQKIAKIFNSPNYIYKIDVVIVTDKGKYNKRIVGKTMTNLITIDNEYIPINSIRDIYISK